jgi:hypothetical protein
MRLSQYGAARIRRSRVALVAAVVLASACDGSSSFTGLLPGSDPLGASGPTVVAVSLTVDAAVDKATKSIDAGEQATFGYVALDAKGNPVTTTNGTKATFKSANPKIIAVDSLTGAARAVSIGTAQVTVNVKVASKSYASSATFTVLPGDTTATTPAPEPTPTPTPTPTTDTLTTSTTPPPGTSTTSSALALVMLKGVASGRCIDIAYATRAPGGQVILYDCVTGAPDETWSLGAVGAAAPVTIFDATLCLVDASGSGAEGAALTTAACSGAAAQNWTLTSAGQLQHTASGKCATAKSAGTLNMTGLVLSACTTGTSLSTSQTWTTASSVAAPTSLPLVPETPEPLTTSAARQSSVALVVTRFDGQNGAALVTSGIPLVKGALLPGQESQTHLTVDGVEVPLYAASLASRHSDGSVRSLFVQFRMSSLGATENHVASLVIGGGARSGALLLSSPIATPGSSTTQGGAPAGVPQAAALPSAVSYLLQTDLVGPTVSSATTASLGGAFARYESDFTTFANQHWTAVGPAWNDGNYYDRALVYTAAWVRSGNPVYWARAAQQAVNYRDGYVVPANFGPSAHWSLLEGQEKHYLLTGDEASRATVLRVAEYLTQLLPEYYGPISGDAREMSRFLQASLLAWRLTPGGVARPAGTSTRDWGPYLDWLLGKVYTWQTADGRFPSDGICKGQLNYMVGMLNTSLIKVYEQYRADAKIQDAVKRAADYLMTTQWRPEASAFNYANVTCTTGSPDPAADLGGFFADAYGFLYQRTGQASYRIFGEQVFAGAVAGAYLPGAKQFNQQYHTSFRYLGYRLSQ